MQYLKLKKELKEKRLFIFYGLLNVFLTNFFLQFLIIILPTILATLISQLFNLNFGYYYYGKKVFNINKLRKSHFINYLILNVILWNLNWILINFLIFQNISKNISALLVVPFLALLSFTYQKYIIFID